MKYILIFITALIFSISSVNASDFSLNLPKDINTSKLFQSFSRSDNPIILASSSCTSACEAYKSSCLSACYSNGAKTNDSCTSKCWGDFHTCNDKCGK